MKNVEKKFIELNKIIEEIKENFKFDLDNIAEMCEKYDLDSDEIQDFGFDLIINRMVISKLEKKIGEIYDEFKKVIDDEHNIKDKNIY